jgi:hypothetical protein
MNSSFAQERGFSFALELHLSRWYHQNITCWILGNADVPSQDGESDKTFSCHICRLQRSCELITRAIQASIFHRQL